jgi:Tat protein secretion system quality control protein TatD with DNase activity
MPEYFDIHSHLNFKDFDLDREEVIAEMKAENIWTNTVGVDLKSSEEAVELAKKHDNLFATIGLHPADDSVEKFNEEAFEKLVLYKKSCGDRGNRTRLQVHSSRQQPVFANTLRRGEGKSQTERRI